MVSHAVRPANPRSQVPTRVVLPKPAGAVTSTTECDQLSSSRRVSRARGTVPVRAGGMSSFVATTCITPTLTLDRAADQCECLPSTTMNPLPEPRDTADFYALADDLPEPDRQLLARLRAFLDAELAPVANWHWAREKFPHHLIEPLGKLGVGGLSYTGYDLPGRTSLLDGFV